MEQINNELKNAPFHHDYQSVSGIDALYFHIDVNFDDYTQFYNNFILNNALNNNYFKMLSHDNKKQFTYYEHFCDVADCEDSLESSKMTVCKIGFKNLNQNDNNFFIKIQIDTIYLQQNTIHDIIKYFTDLINSFGINIKDFPINRVDLNSYLFNFNLDWLDITYFSTKIKDNQVKLKSDKKQTFYFGSRDSILFRIYDKLAELTTLDYETSLKKKYLIDMKYVRKYHQEPKYEQLWNIEVELKRETLKNYNIYTLNDLINSINGLHTSMLNNTFRLLVRKKDFSNNDNRIVTHSLWNHLIGEYNYNNSSKDSLSREIRKKYLKDETWLLNRLTEFLQESRNTDIVLNANIKNLADLLTIKTNCFI